MCTSSIKSFSCVWLFATPWTAAHQASLSISNYQSLLKLMSIESVVQCNHLIFCWPVLLPTSVFPCIRVFSNESVLHIRWPKYWSFSFSISPSKEYSGLISFRIDWFDLLAIQEILKSLLQHQSLKASILWPSAFFIVQLSHPYMTTGKTIALTGWIFVGKVMSLLFNMLSRWVIVFLPRSKHLLILWLTVTICSDFRAPQNKVCHFPLFSHLFAMKWWNWMPWSSFSECWVLASFFHSPFTKRLFSSFSLSAIIMVSSACLRLLIFLPTILISACASFSPTFCMVYSAYKLNKQGDNIHPWCTPFPIWNQFGLCNQDLRTCMFINTWISLEGNKSK